MQRIVVIEGELGEKNLERLQKQFPQFTFQMFPTGHAEEAAVRQAEVVVVNANRKLVKPAESAKYIHTLSAGVDGILDDLEQYHPQALFTNAAGVYDDCVGEHMLMLMLAASRDLRHDIERMADGCWDKQPVKAEIAGSNVLVLGTGSIGGLLFVVSDFIMIYYSFGKKIKPLRAINLLSYYAAQLLIALCILYH